MVRQLPKHIQSFSTRVTHYDVPTVIRKRKKKSFFYRESVITNYDLFNLNLIAFYLIITNLKGFRNNRRIIKPLIKLFFRWRLHNSEFKNETLTSYFSRTDVRKSARLFSSDQFYKNHNAPDLTKTKIYIFRQNAYK